MPSKKQQNITALKPEHTTVAIVGRPNVGKSALFNLIIKRRMAIVHEQSGVTRDRVAAMASYDDRRFLLIDTGGLGIFEDEKKGKSPWDDLIRQQLTVAIEGADKVIFVVDSHEGIQPLDHEVARLLRENDKKVFLVANKADNDSLVAGTDEFLQLGFPVVRPISCTQRTGVGDVLSEVCDDIPASDPSSDDARLKIAVVGRPNVGKSSIINHLLGEDRVIVSDVAGTTRDAIDIPFSLEHDGKKYQAELVDTAGLRRKNKIDTVVELFSMGRTEHAVEKADVVLVVMDATQAGTAQDRKICRMVADAGKACMILLNKWDLASVDMKQRELIQTVEYELPFMAYADKITCCAVSGYNLSQLMPSIIELSEQLDVEFPTSLVNRVIRDAVLRLPPPRKTHGPLKVFYATCVKRRPPTFLVFVNDSKRCPRNYEVYLRSRFIDAFGIHGIPTVLELRNRRDGDDPNRQRPTPKTPKREAGAPGKAKKSSGKKAASKKGAVKKHVPGKKKRKGKS